jgi:hypothetical protein
VLDVQLLEREALAETRRERQAERRAKRDLSDRGVNLKEALREPTGSAPRPDSLPEREHYSGAIVPEAERSNVQNAEHCFDANVQHLEDSSVRDCEPLHLTQHLQEESLPVKADLLLSLAESNEDRHLAMRADWGEAEWDRHRDERTAHWERVGEHARARELAEEDVRRLKARLHELVRRLVPDA